MDLKCKKLNCKNNDRYSCMKDCIRVGSDSSCNSFEVAEDVAERNKKDASRDMFETAPDYHPFRLKRNVDIECGADCLFNTSGKCKANGISVCSCSNDAICTTFIKK